MTPTATASKSSSHSRAGRHHPHPRRGEVLAKLSDSTRFQGVRSPPNGYSRGDFGNLEPHFGVCHDEASEVQRSRLWSKCTLVHNDAL